ncbi:MAG: c-type cytochrome, partial [Alphaproteobacteria bacterium]
MIGKRGLVLAGALAMIFAGGAAFADGDAAKGEKVFKKCKSCHTLQAGKNKVGPNLAGIVGRKAAAADGYKYSGSLKKAAAKGLAWDEENL